MYVPPKSAVREPWFGVGLLLQKARGARSNANSRVKAEAHAILSGFRAGVPIPTGRIERQLRKLNGIKEITINHLSHTVKVRYDPDIVTVEKIRSLIRKLGRGKAR